MRTSVLLFLVCAAMGCGGPPRGLPDYSELLSAGVVPSEEADRVVDFLARSDFVLVDRVEVGPAIALSFLRASDQHRAIRVVTPEGVSLALDSLAENGVLVSAGAVELDGERSGGDLDRDGRLDILVTRREEHRVCLLVIEVAPEGDVEPLRVDAADLDTDVCLEELRDVNGDGRVEAIVALYGSALASDRPIRAPLPLEADEAGVFRRTPPAVAFLSAETARIDLALAEARRRDDTSECLALAIERAFLLHAAGRSTEAQLSAFDEAIAATIWPEAFSRRLEQTRTAITLGHY